MRWETSTRRAGRRRSLMTFSSVLLSIAPIALSITTPHHVSFGLGSNDLVPKMPRDLRRSGRPRGENCHVPTATPETTVRTRRKSARGRRPRPPRPLRVKLGSRAEIKERVRLGQERLAQAYPMAENALVHDGPLELLIATILSAQCTDERVNMVTPALFKKYRDARAYSEA